VKPEPPVEPDRIAISDTDNYVTVTLNQSEFGTWNSVGLNAGSHAKELTNEIYKKFKDDFDFIIYIMNNNTRPSGMPYGEFSMTKNDTSGIGLNDFDITNEYGSHGKLQGVIGLYASMNEVSVLKALHLDASLHEIFHRWGNWIVNDGAPGHWANVDGVLSNSSTFAPIELYLMGLISNPYGTDANLWDSESKIVYSMWEADKDRFKPRTPTVNKSQKQFRSLVVLLTEEGNPIDASMATRLSSNIENFQRTDGKHKVYSSVNVVSRNFWNASRGLATMKLDGVSATLK